MSARLLAGNSCCLYGPSRGRYTAMQSVADIPGDILVLRVIVQ